MRWFGRPSRPTDYILTSQIANLIDAFLAEGDANDWTSDRLRIVVGRDYRVAISAAGGDHLVAVPLNSLAHYIPAAVRSSPQVRHMAVDMAAMDVVRRLLDAEQGPRDGGTLGGLGRITIRTLVLVAIGGVVAKILTTAIWQDESALEKAFQQAEALMRPKLPMRVDGVTVLVEVAHICGRGNQDRDRR